MLGGLIRLAIALLVGLGAMGAHAAENTFDRSKREAKQLFRDYFGSGGLSRCGLSPKWAAEAVPYQVAKKFFGLNIAADLAGVHAGSEPADVMDVDKRYPAAFCGQEMVAQLRSELRDALIADGPTEADRVLPPKRRTHVIEAYSFPVFNPQFDRAMVFAVSETSGYQKLENEVKPCCLMVVGTAEAFRKRNGSWHHTRTDRIYHAH
jgi:hypothetical protein